MAGKPWAKDDPRRAFHAERMRKIMADPALRERSRAIMKKVRSDPNHERMRRAKRYTKENKRRASQRLKAMHRDPKFSTKVRAALKAARENPGYRGNTDTTKARLARAELDRQRRGGDIPQGYEVEYRRLRKIAGAAGALTIIRRRIADHEPVPESYRETYNYLVGRMELGPADAHEIIRAQVAADGAIDARIT
jgi:hypothetical protein